MLVLDRDAASTVPQDFHTVYRTVDDERLAPNDQALLSLGDEVSTEWKLEIRVLFRNF